MKIILHNFLSFLISLTIIFSCSSTAKLYPYDDKQRSYTGQLSDSSYFTLKQFLTAATNPRLADTIIIKYDYNNRICWESLDQKEDDYIMSFVTAHHERVQKVLSTRPNVSVFDFREPGNNLNKIKKWDKAIIVDSTRQLFHLLFKERCICGSSIIVLPDKRFVFLRSDSHSEALDYSHEKIKELLTKK